MEYNNQVGLGRVGPKGRGSMGGDPSVEQSIKLKRVKTWEKLRTDTPKKQKKESSNTTKDTKERKKESKGRKKKQMKMQCRSPDSSTAGH